MWNCGFLCSNKTQKYPDTIPLYLKTALGWRWRRLAEKRGGGVVWLNYVDGVKKFEFVCFGGDIYCNRFQLEFYIFYRWKYFGFILYRIFFIFLFITFYIFFPDRKMDNLCLWQLIGKYCLYFL